MATLFRLAVTRTAFAAALLAGFVLSGTFQTTGARAADEAIFAPGEPIVTGFSGVAPPEAPPAGSDPLDYTLIDPAGPSMVVQQL